MKIKIHRSNIAKLGEEKGELIQKYQNLTTQLQKKQSDNEGLERKIKELKDDISS